MAIAKAELTQPVPIHTMQRILQPALTQEPGFFPPPTADRLPDTGSQGL